MMSDEEPNGRNVEVRFLDGSYKVFSPGPDRYSWVQFAIANGGLPKLPKWLAIDDYSSRYVINTDNIEYMRELPV